MGTSRSVNGSGGAPIGSKAATIVQGVIGAAYPLRASVKGPVAWSKVSGHSNLSVAAGAIVLAAPIAAGASQSIVVRGSNGTTAAEFQVTLTGADTGVTHLVDELGGVLLDELGGALAGPDSYTSIKAAAAARGILYGIAYKPDHPSDTPTYRALVLDQASMLIPETASQATAWCPAQGTYDFTRLGQFVDIALGAGLPWIVPSGFIYPAHDMPWVDDTTVTAANYQSIIDGLVSAFAAFCTSKGSWPKRINVTNETIDNAQTDKWRRHSWYNAAGGPAWIVYLAQKLRAAFPTTPLGLCQDLTEQINTGLIGDNYCVNMRNAFLAKVDELTGLGWKPDYIDLQSHLRVTGGFDAVGIRNYLEAIKGRGIKITAGELDVRAANGGVVPGMISPTTTPGIDAISAQLMAQYFAVLLPYLSMGDFGVWCLGDAYNAWGVGERSLIYDTSLNVKPAMRDAFLENLNLRSA